MPECIDESCIDIGLKTISFFLGISSVMFVRFRMCEVDRFMRDIEIAAEYDGSIHLETPQIIKKQ